MFAGLLLVPLVLTVSCFSVAAAPSSSVSGSEILMEEGKLFLELGLFIDN